MNSSICLVECPRVQRDKTISRLLLHSEEPISSGGARRIAERDWCMASRARVRGFPNFEPRTTNFGSRLSPRLTPHLLRSVPSADLFSILLVWREYCGIQFQQAVVAVGYMFDCEETIANVDSARHHASVYEKSKVPVRGVLEEPAYDG